MSLLDILKPAPHIERLPADKVDKEYARLRRQVFIGIFVGYAGYYLVRKNFSLAVPYLVQEGFTKAELGWVMSALAISYGLSKFVMGVFSDRSNPRYFMAAGLMFSALISIMYGAVPWATSTVAVMYALMFANGWVQGMGWPPCGRTMTHWYSVSERGTKVAVWNVAHNVGGGIIGPLASLGILLFVDWHSVFYFPAIIALAVAVFIILTVRDTPQSCGLPPIEEYKNEYPAEHAGSDLERELSAKEILFKYVLNNKFLWYIALANVFVYLVRYGVLDWAPTYLTEVKDFSHNSSRWAYFLYEYAGIPGTILCGWLSDKVFRGRRAPAGIVFMIGVAVAVLVYWFNPPGNPLVDNLALIAIGFLIYGPVMLIGLHALDLVPKKAAGTAAGFTGLFGYMGGTVMANAAIGKTVDVFGWDGGFVMLVGACVLAIFFMALTWNHGAKVKTNNG
ncbi:glycerol-3-phosphate transporter [Desulforamulus hydrothermalis]|uniref:glycerol-3-phosphate transporter n=1 Tax=Desulforamulus hydrothermalis TaxID=412895 RepID=UPI00091ED5EF|nr:glycerol-3-phosphate transporter [Desulforamulus hydrothermalis]SHG93474.1 MFS transporter, OPA family, glycerol-3-phosphate transporter [Desulforamulus hydrothermalis Lam5 = DSM 18033]